MSLLSKPVDYQALKAALLREWELLQEQDSLFNESRMDYLRRMLRTRYQVPQHEIDRLLRDMQETVTLDDLDEPLA